MKILLKHRNPFISVMLCICLIASTFLMPIPAYAAVTEDSISYCFTGSDADTAGYAEGTVTLTSAEGGTYDLYWADKNENPLDGYYEITSMTLSENESGTFEFGYHTAIPADAEKIIAVKSDGTNACAVYTLPDKKILPYNSNQTLYTFNSYSDIHIDAGGYYVNAEKNWASALNFAVNKNTDFIVTSGDSITNASGPKQEWDTYEKILANSNYLNPVYESNGNHDLRTGVSIGTKAYVKSSGTDNTIVNYEANKPYYSVREKNTNDLFIFMALEYVYNPSSGEEFSDAQLEWVENLLKENYGKGSNIYIIEHSHLQGYGAGDYTENPYYKAGLSTQYMSTVKFKSLLQKYPDIIWISGHTHEDYNMGYNYSNENGTACNMIHNSSIAGPTHPSAESHSLDYTFFDGLSQGYYVAVYNDSVIFYGANVCDEKIYPAYSYIMNGSRQSDENATNPTDPLETVPPTAATGSTLGDDVETTTYYFVNTLKWQFVNCYAWSDDDTKTCEWPGYACTYFATDEYGNDVYYAKIPSSLNKVIFNNGGNGKQTVDITIDGTNNCFTPDKTTTSEKYNVNTSVWDGIVPTDPIVTDPTANTTIETETTVPVTDPTDETTAPVTDPTDETTVPVTSSTDETTAPDTNESTETIPSDPYTLGDVDNDGYINAKDATLIQMHLVKFTILNEIQLNASDVDADNIVNIKDATYIQLFAAHLINNLPALETNNADTAYLKLYNSALISNFSALQTYSIDTSLNKAKDALNNYYQFSSYDQYQTLKKLYYTYLALDNPSEETKDSMAAQIENAISDLKSIADYIIAKEQGNGYAKNLVLYFAVPDQWLDAGYTVKSNLCFDKVDNLWGQHKMIQTTDKYQGLTVFRYTYSAMDFVSDSIETLQFQAYEGSTWKAQFVAASTKTKCDSINGMLYDSKTEKWVSYTPSEGTTDVTEPLPDAEYGLCYYTSSHSWDTLDTFFTKQADGIYTLDFTAANTADISCNVYKFADSTYNCVEASTSFDIIASTSNSKVFNLSPSTSRGKSITLKGVTEGNLLKFVYDSNTNTLTISYDLTQDTTDPKQSDYVLCHYTSTHAWTDMDTFFVQESDNIHKLSYTAVSDENISLNVFNMSDSTYNCVAESESLTITKGTEDSKSFTLQSSSSREKSITLFGVTKGMVLNFVYDSNANTLTISYDLSEELPYPAPSDYALCFYNSTHPWTEIDTFFIQQSENIHTLSYTAISDENISLNVYNKSDNTYNCVAESTSVSIPKDSDLSETIKLQNSSSRGSSITLRGIKTGMKIEFIYHSDTNTLNIIYNNS